MTGIATIGKGLYQPEGVARLSGPSRLQRAKDPRTQELVALKLLQSPQRQKDRVRLAREAEAYRYLGRYEPIPGLVRFLDYESDEHTTDGPFVVLEWVEGETIAQRLTKSEKIPESEAIEVARSLCSIVGQLHQRGVIHRDLSLNNVFLAQGPGKEKVRLIDLGLSLVPDGQGGYRDHDTGQVGTPKMMAPELSTTNSGDVRSDIYSIGEMLKRMALGKDYDTQKKEGLHPDLIPSLPKDLSKVVEKCKKEKPTERFQSMEELDRALQGIQRNRWLRRIGIGLAAVVALGTFGVGSDTFFGSRARLVVPIVKTPTLVIQQDQPEPQSAPVPTSTSAPTMLQTPTSIPVASQEPAPTKPQKKAKPAPPPAPTDDIDEETRAFINQQLLKAAAQPVIYKPKGPIEVRVDLKE